MDPDIDNYKLLLDKVYLYSPYFEYLTPNKHICILFIIEIVIMSLFNTSTNRSINFMFGLGNHIIFLNFISG